KAIQSLSTAKLIAVRIANNHPVPDPRAPRNAVAEEAAIHSWPPPIKAAATSVMAVNEPGLSRQADSTPAVTRDYENRPRSNLPPASVPASAARVVPIDEHLRLSAEPDP